MTFNWQAQDLSDRYHIVSSDRTGLKLIMRACGTGTPVLFVRGATFSGSIFEMSHPEVNWLLAATDRPGNGARRNTSVSVRVRSTSTPIFFWSDN